MGAFTSKAAGRWLASGQTTWNEVGAPGAGDTATVAHAVTVAVGDAAIIGDGTATTVLTVTTGGSITITGGTLQIRGNSSWGDNAYTVLIASGFWLTIQNSGATPGGLELDGNSGVTPIVTANLYADVKILGTSSARCFVRTATSGAKLAGSGGVGNPGRFVGAGTGSLITSAAYGDFSYLGDSTHPGWGTCDLTAGSPFGFATFDHCTFSHCGSTPYILLTLGDNIVSLTNSTWSNVVGITTWLINANNAKTGGTRLIDSNVHLGSGASPVFGAQQDFTITNNYFDDWIAANCSIEGPSWAVFTGNFTRTQVVGEKYWAGDVGVGGGNYFFADSTGGGALGLISDFQNFTITGNVFDTSYATTGGYCVGFTEASTGDRPACVVSYNVQTPSGAVGWSLVAATTNSTPTNTIVCNVKHNTAPVNISAGAVNIAGTGAGERAGCLSLIQDNLFIELNGPTNPAVVNSGTSNNPSTGVVVDTVTAAHCNHNGYSGCAVQPATYWTVTHATTSATTCSDGTPYQSAMSGATAPGASDVNLGTISDSAAAGPKFVDPLRNLATWAVHKGYNVSGDTTASKVANALSNIQGDAVPGTLTADALAWVQAGFAPTATSLHGTASDSTDIGAVAWVAGSATNTMSYGAVAGSAVGAYDLVFPVAPNTGSYSAAAGAAVVAYDLLNAITPITTTYGAVAQRAHVRYYSGAPTDSAFLLLFSGDDVATLPGTWRLQPRNGSGRTIPTHKITATLIPFTVPAGVKVFGTAINVIASGDSSTADAAILAGAYAASGAVDNTSNGYLGGSLELKVDGGTITSPTSGPVEFYLQASPDGGTTWPDNGQGTLIAKVPVSAGLATLRVIPIEGPYSL